MNSKLYRGEITHARLTPQGHSFAYPAYLYGFDLDEVQGLSKQLPWFGYNCSRPVSLYDSDHLQGDGRTLREGLAQILPPVPLGQVLLVTVPRCLGYVFNPVSFWFCFSPCGVLQSLVAEVNNTFGERHTYLLDQPLSAPGQFPARFRVPKAFYVSPFNDVSGEYEFCVEDPRERLDIRLTVFKDSQAVFDARVRGVVEPLQGLNWLRTLPSNWLTVPRIHWQAALLYFRKKLPIVYKPRPNSPQTLRAEPPTALHRFILEKAREFLQRARTGHLSVDLPNGEVWTCGDPHGERAVLRVLNYDFFLSLWWNGDVALGDGYVSRQWDSPDVTAVVRFCIDNREHLEDKKLGLSRTLAIVWGRLRHRLRANSLVGSRRNIQAHYDLGNELYRRFLDPTMSYSCAYYATADDDLETAQRNKIKLLLTKARLDPDCHLLEIGCGWGSLAIEAVRQTGCKVTGLTLSQEQATWARERIAKEGLQERIEIKLCDYRQLQGSFDRIISCEMLEAVGHENFPDYFAALERLLKPDGLVVLQVITVPDFSYEEYRRNRDWIQKEIFPGALCPSITALLQAMSLNSQLVLEHLENLAPHYARTLKEWRQRFWAKRGELETVGYDAKFQRAWTYYLSYCEAAFATRNLGDIQMVLTRPKNRRLLEDDFPWLH